MEIAYYNFNLESWYFPAGPVAKTMLPMQGTKVQFLVRELRSHMAQLKPNQSINIFQNKARWNPRKTCNPVFSFY